jgi:Mn-dependent DtxR family transcriptional regulator
LTEAAGLEHLADDEATDALGELYVTRRLCVHFSTSRSSFVRLRE